MKPQDDWDLVEKILDMNQAEFAAKIKEEADEAGEEGEDANNAGEADAVLCSGLCCALL